MFVQGQECPISKGQGTVLPIFETPTYIDTVSSRVTKFVTLTQLRNRHVFTVKHAHKTEGERHTHSQIIWIRYILVFLLTSITSHNAAQIKVTVIQSQKCVVKMLSS